MFVRTLHRFGKSPSRTSTRQRRAKVLPGAGSRPQVERLEDRTLLSAANQDLVAQMYQDLLQRPADAGGLANWTAALDHGASAARVALDLAQSQEARALQVQSLYKQFLHRGADSAGLAGFTQSLASGQTLEQGMRDEQIAAAIVGSPEFAQSVQSGGGSLQQTLLPNPPVAGLPVIVVNTPSQPVPVTGTVTGTVTGNVQAQQSGAWNVGITGTPSVNIANSPTVLARQSGPWTVGISSTPTVQVASLLGNPVFIPDVSNAVQPFQVV